MELLSTTSAQRPKYRTGSVRDYVFPILIAAAVWFIPLARVVDTMVIIGQAHFFMAYLYQVRGHKITTRYLVVAAILSVLGIACAYSGISTKHLFLAAGMIFSAHFALDEFTLHGESLTYIRGTTLIGFVLFFSAIIAMVAFPGVTFISSILGISILAAFFARCILMRMYPSRAEQYLWLVSGMLFLMAISSDMAEKVLAVIVLLHFANWYVGYGERLKHSPERSKKYWREMLATLLTSGLLFWGYSHLDFTWLAVLFRLDYFYLWTAAHIILSFVTATYRIEH
jgi:hypothetical protein